jgi:hypothetical protein
MREQREILQDFAAPVAVEEFGITSGTTTAPPAFSATFDALVTSEPSRGLVVGRRRQQRLDITLAQGGITEAEADAYVLGVFRNVAPAGAAAAVDASLNGAIGELITRQMVSSGVGEITTLPVARHRHVRTEAVMLAGLGTVGAYREPVLEAVGESVMRAAVLARLDDFAIVPVGASAGTRTAVSVTHLMAGFMKALRASREQARIRGFTICEIDPDRFREIRDTFYQLLRSPIFEDVEVTLTETELPPPAVAARGAAKMLANRGPDPVYLLLREELEATGTANVVGSVLTSGGKAAIYRGRKRLDSNRLRTLLDKVSRGAAAIGDIKKFGTELGELVLEGGLLEILARETAVGRDGTMPPLVVVHDAAMSRVPWETLHLKNAVAPALGGGLSHRYDGGILSVAKWTEERAQKPDLDMLLVVDPTEDLPEARREGDRIRALLRERLVGARLRELRGPQARRKELLDCFASGSYDVVHYAGLPFSTRPTGRVAASCATGTRSSQVSISPL